MAQWARGRKQMVARKETSQRTIERTVPKFISADHSVRSCELRFSYPEPPDAWTEVKDTTKPPNCCMQLPEDTTFMNFSGTAVWNPNTPVSEDCLYLNVWAPRTNPPYANKAVMVWVYGGSFSSGSSALDVYDGLYLAADNDVVVVSMQFRIGALGFLTFGSNEAPGNAGMMDLVMALQWVQTNIHSFGGNSHNVTLMGESSGAVSIGLLMLSSLSRELFHRAILQSGAPQVHWGTYTVTEGRRRAIKLAELLQCDTQTSDTEIIKCLRRKPAELFPFHELNITRGIAQFPFVPAIDGRFLRMSPAEYLREGSFKKAPVLLGSNANEGTWLLVYYEAQHFNIVTESLISRRQYDEVMSSIFQYYPQFPKELNHMAREAIRFKYIDWIDPEDQVRLRGQVEKAVGDHFFTCSVVGFAKALAKAGQDVYLYRFSQRMSSHDWPKWMGVMHGDEIFFVFGLPLKYSHKFTREEKELSRKMMTFWSNFAKTGNPNRGPGELDMREWPKFRHNEQLYLNLSTDMFNSSANIWGQGVRTEYCGFLDNYIPHLVRSEPSYSTNCSMTAASTSKAILTSRWCPALTISLTMISSSFSWLCPMALKLYSRPWLGFIPGKV
uniref:Carboxylic ester hydrolase n=1 Tax=Biomphalaria glabrata TaxID=6526 RepID=A0A2C9JKE7_BIOGL